MIPQTSAQANAAAPGRTALNDGDTCNQVFDRIGTLFQFTRYWWNKKFTPRDFHPAREGPIAKA